MKILIALCALCLTGCASYTTHQSDMSEYDGSGKITRTTTTTRVAARTFFSGKSELTKSKATQTAKTQTSLIGQLSQEGGQTNQLSDIIGAAVAAAVKAAKTP